MLELICTRESGAVFEAGGLNCVLSFIRDSGHLVHKDTLHSAMAVVSRLCSKMEPQDSSLETCVESLSSLLKHEDHQVNRTPTQESSVGGGFHAHWWWMDEFSLYHINALSFCRSSI